MTRRNVSGILPNNRCRAEKLPGNAGQRIPPLFRLAPATSSAECAYAFPPYVSRRAATIRYLRFTGAFFR